MHGREVGTLVEFCTIRLRIMLAIMKNINGYLHENYSIFIFIIFILTSKTNGLIIDFFL